MLELIDGRDLAAPVRITRPARPGADRADEARAIVERVRLEGDAALLELTERFDGARLERDAIRVDEAAIAAARSLVRPELVDALEVEAERLRATCERQRPAEWFDERPGELTGELVRPLRRVGLVVPGGRPRPSLVMAAVVPARVAGVEGVAVASPADARGDIAEPVLAACAIAGVGEVYRVGGAQAVAALSYGTTSVRPVDKVVAPGDAYVAPAKRHVRGWVGTDLDSGPSELLIVADGTADAGALAGDLAAHAEHGAGGTHALITWVPGLADEVASRLELAVMRHERPDAVENALIEGGRAVLVRDLEHALGTANAFAPARLQLVFDGARAALGRVRSAGAVLVGRFSPASAGDFVTGAGPVLPAGGGARWASGLSVRDFVTTIPVSGLDEGALARLRPHVEALAEAEGLPAHARALELRLDRPGRGA